MVLLPLAEVWQGCFGPGAFVEALSAASRGLWPPRVGDTRTPQAITDILVNIDSGGPGLPVNDLTNTGQKV